MYDSEMGKALSKEELEKIKRAWEAPLAKPVAVPKPSSTKKRGRPKKEVTEDE